MTGDRLVAFARDVIDRARAFPPDRLTTFTANVAGITVQAGASDPALAALYQARLGLPLSPGPDSGPEVRIVSLSAGDLGFSRPPVLTAHGKEAKWFHALLAEAGLKGPVLHDRRVWRLYDPSDGFGVQLVGETGDLPPWDAGSPFLNIIRFALAERGLRLCHAGSLADNGRGLLLVGDGGAGKSATTLSGIVAGLSTVGDDYIAVQAGEPFVARPLFRIAKQAPAFLKRLGDQPAALAAERAVNWQGKIELNLEEMYPGRLVDEMAVTSIVVPRVTGRDGGPKLDPVPPAIALRAAIRTNLFQHGGEPDDGLSFFARLMRVPCYQLELGTDLRANAMVLKGLIHGEAM